METIVSIKPLVAILVSLIGPLLIVSARKNPNLRESCTFLIAFVKLGIVASMLPAVLGGKTIYFSLVEVLPGVGITLW